MRIREDGADAGKNTKETSCSVKQNNDFDGLAVDQSSRNLLYYIEVGLSISLRGIYPELLWTKYRA